MKTDYKTIQVELKDRLALFILNNPPVNQLSQHFVLELVEAFTEANNDEKIKAIVLTGTGRNFLAGADITQIKAVKTRDEILPKLKQNIRFLNAIETGPKPVVAAINGNCLGGGLDIAMVCHYRVAARGSNRFDSPCQWDPAVAASRRPALRAGNDYHRQTHQC